MRPIADPPVSYGMGQARRKVRKVAKWVGVVIVLLVLGTDLLSLWYGVAFVTRDYMVALLEGRLVLRQGASRLPRMNWPHAGWNIDDLDVGHHQWSLHFVSDTSTGTWAIFVPIWPVVAFCGATTAWLRWLERPKRGPGHCPACNYDLTGLAPSSTCPECGRSA